VKQRLTVARKIAHGAWILTRGALVFFTFIVALSVGAVLHIGLPSARRVAVKELNSILSPSFVGTVTLEEVAGLGIFGARGITVHVDGPDGTRLLYARGVRATIFPLRVVTSELFGKGPLGIDVGVASIDYVEASLDTDANGDLKLSHAFDPRTPSPEPAQPGRGLRLAFPRFTLAHAWLHGVIPGAPPVDADLDGLKGSLLVAPDVTKIDVDKLAVLTRALPKNANLEGSVEAHVSIPSGDGGTQLAALFDGSVGGIPTTTHASMVGKQLDAVLDIPEVTAARVQEFMAEAPVYQPVSAHAEAHGELTDVHATGLLSAGRGRVTLDGHASIGDDTTATARVEASEIDARAFTPSGVHTSVGAIVDLHVRKPKVGPLEAGVAIDIPVGRYGDQLIPHAIFRGNVSQNTDARRGAVGIGGHVTGRIDEVGAPTTLEVEASPSSLGEQVTFDVRADIRHLDHFRRFGDLGPGRAELEANGRVVLSSPPTVDGAVHAELEGLARGANRIRSADVKVLARGPLTNPALKTSLEANGIEVASYRLAHVSAAASGLLDNQDIMLSIRGEKNFPTVEGRANVELKDGLAVHAANIVVSRDDALVALRVGEARIGNGKVVVRDAVLDGLGSAAHASFREDGGRVTIKANAEALDLKRLGFVLRMEDTIKRGQLAFDVDVDAGRSEATGHAKIKADHVCVSSIDEASMDVDVTMKGREVTGLFGAGVKDVVSFNLRTDGVHIGGRGPLDASAWRKAWGKVTFAAKADVGKLAAMVPAERLPVADVSGKFGAEGEVARDSESDDTPEILLSAATQGLIVGTKSGPVKHNGKIEIIAPPRSKTMGIDGQLDVRVDGKTGFAEVATRLVDQKGAIVGLDAKSVEIPYKELMSSFDGAGERLAKVPFSMTIAVPGRKLEDFPAWIKVPGGSGNIEGTVTLTGSADDPKLVAALHGHSIRVPGLTPGTHLDGDLALTYDGEKGDLEIHMRSPEKELLVASARLDAKIKGALIGAGGIGAWTASAKGTLSDFPLAALGPLSDRQVEGHISGDFSLDDLHKDARAKLAIKVDDLEVGTAKYKSGFVNVSLDGSKGLEAAARLEQAVGFLDLKAKMAMTWGAAVAPAPDPKGTTEATLQAKQFRIVAVLPLLQSQLSELDGNVDADAKFSVSGGGKPTMQGDVRWTNGLLQANALGEEFHAVNAKVSLSPDGVVRLEDMTMAGPSGKVHVAATAKLDGLSLSSAEATIKIDKKDALPLDVAGATMGQIYGDIGVKAQSSSDNKKLTISVDVPKLHVEIPLTSMASVQDLGQPKDEHIGYFSTPTRFIVLPADAGDITASAKPADESPNVTEIKVKLRNVEIQRGTTLKVLLDGDPQVVIADKTVVRGQIHLKSGTLEVQGKKFAIEKGVVSFVGKDADNPEISVTAGWTAEDGTHVYADFIGPLKTGKVTLRSEPARPRNEIVALILFGTADGSQSTPYASPSQNNETRVGTTAGGFATEGLSKGLDQVTGMDIATKIDTSDSANPRPEVEVQIAKDISVQLAFVLGTPPPGMNPDTTYASIDWRFVRNWTLETTFGNLGSTIADVVWQYRY
jgi:translocation and assembly module TamB